MKWAVEPVPELWGYVVEWAEHGNYYLSRRNRLFHSDTLKPPFEEICTIDAPLWKEVAARSRLAQRLLRFMVTNVVPLHDGQLFISFDKSVGIVANGKYHELKSLVRPCRVLPGACAVDKTGNIFFGEYLANHERGEMYIYKYGRDNELQIVYTFAANAIKHVHGIYFDEFTDSLFCLTGDDKNECQIIQTFDEFQTIRTIGHGDETWRAVSLLFTPDSIFYGTDAEYRANRVYRLDRSQGERKDLGEVNGTVFYSKKIGDDLFFATTAENAPSQIENVVSIWSVPPDGSPEPIAKFRKDRWHPTLFQFGTVRFPYFSNLNNELLFHLVGVEEDNQTFRIRRQVV